VLRGGNDVAREAACFVAGGHSIDDPEPKYGMAVTGWSTRTGCCATTRPWPVCRSR
jgi:selenophosphate synthase